MSTKAINNNQGPQSVSFRENADHIALDLLKNGSANTTERKFQSLDGRAVVLNTVEQKLGPATLLSLLVAEQLLVPLAPHVPTAVAAVSSASVATIATVSGIALGLAIVGLLSYIVYLLLNQAKEQQKGVDFLIDFEPKGATKAESTPILNPELAKLDSRFNSSESPSLDDEQISQ